MADKGYITVVISGGENATDSGFYQVHPKIKLYKYGVVQPGQSMVYSKLLCTNNYSNVCICASIGRQCKKNIRLPEYLVYSFHYFLDAYMYMNIDVH